MPLHRRVPKRGFHNPFRIEYEIVNLDALVLKFDAGTVITPELLRERGLVSRGTGKVKILARRRRQGADDSRPQVQRQGGGENQVGGRADFAAGTIAMKVGGSTLWTA